VRFVSTERYRDFDAQGEVDKALGNVGQVVLHYTAGFYVYEVDEVAVIGTSGGGTILVLLTNGQLVMHNTATDTLLSQQVPFEKFIGGPSDGGELLAVWNEWKQKESQA
jgi:hypothetical protein